MTIGAVLGGMIMKIGRRKAILISNLIGLIGLGITMVENFNVILVGRFIFGFSVGLKSVVSPRYIEETVPNHLFSTIAPFFSWTQTVGVLTSYLLAEILPKKD